jgi:uncharacterized protein with von Willebrand factor type A (vWA) domain
MTTAKAINLANLDVIVLVDQSGSMETPDTLNKKSRWDFSKEAAQGIVGALAKHDDDGIDLIFFNRSQTVYEKVKDASFMETWNKQRPGGGTDLVAPLQKAFALAEKRWGEKNQFIIVFTDGAPDDQGTVAQTIIDFTKKMERDEQVAILFARVGQDTGAKAFLEMLDDGLQAKGAKFDIVDCDEIDTIAGKDLQLVVDKAFND